MTTQQGLRQASFRALGGTAGTFDGDMRAAFEAEATIPAGATFDGAFMLWMQARLGSSVDSMPALMQAVADSDSATHWSTMGNFSVFEEDFTGDDDDAFPTARWETAENQSSSTANIQGNKGDLTAAGAAYVRARIRSKSGNLTNFDMTFDMTLDPGAEEYPTISFTRGAAWSSNNAELPADGYALQLYTHATNGDLYSIVSSVRGTGQGMTGLTWAAGTWLGRIQRIGTTTNIRFWQGTEPGTWNLTVVDSDHTTGSIAFAMLNGADAAARTVVFDNIIVRAI